MAILIARAPLIKSIMLLRDLKGTVARRKVKLMAKSLINFATRQMCPSDRARRGLQACPCSALAFFTRYLHAFPHNSYRDCLDHEQACKPEVS